MLKYAYIGCENRNIPATAPNDSCRATLPAENGFVTRISARANDKVVALSFIRPSTGASIRRLIIIPALIADSGEPTMTTNSHTRQMHISDDLRFLPSKLCSTPTRNATCMPDTATTCARPATFIEA